MNQIVNPYIAGSPVTGPEMFFGRQDVFDFIRQTLTGKHRDQVIVLYGRRRTGKTSVLYQMRRHLSDRYLCIFIDLHGLALDGLDGFLWELTNHIRRSLRREYQIELPRPDKSEFMSDPRGQFEEHFLNQLWAETGEKHVLLMLDEAVRLQEQVQAGKLELGIFEYLRHLMQHYERLNFLFSLGSGLEEMEKQYALLFNVALYKRISFLERDAAVALITEPVMEYYEVAPAAVEHILDITSGHPYYTQLICHSVFNHWLGSGARLIGVEDIDDTLDEVVERGLAVLKYVWEESTPAEKAVLAGMAAAMGDAKGAATLDEVMAAWSALDVTIPRGEAVKAVRSLTARDVITGDDAYEFRVDLLHNWLLKYERLDWVREEIAGSIEEWQKIITAVPPKRPRANIPRWAAAPLLLTAAIVFLLLGVSLSSTVRDALPFLAFAVPTEVALPTAVPAVAAAEMTREATIDQAGTDGEASAEIEEDAPSERSVQTINEQEVVYFNDFNDYDVKKHHFENAYVGEIGDEVALILEGRGYASASINELYEDNYELSYDFYSDAELSSWNRHELDFLMPNDALRYEFIFEEVLAFDQTMENSASRIVSSIPHTLRLGWNKIRVIVDQERQLFSLYTNDSHVLSINDIPIEETFAILIESWSAVDTAIDNYMIQTGVTSDGEKIVSDAQVEAEESVIDDEGVYYFNDFNNYNSDGFALDDGFLGEVDGEVAVILEGQSDRDMSRLPFGVELVDLDLESYELRYDLYLESTPSGENGVAVNLMMPDDELRYKFYFLDNLNLQTWINRVFTNEHHEASHNLHIGWNDIRVVVDKDSRTVDLYTNGNHIITVDDVGVENTYEILFETHTAELSAIDNVLLQTVASDEASQGQLLAGPNSGTLQLDGESGYVEVPYADSLNLKDALTIEAWINLNAPPPKTCTVTWSYCNMMPIISQPSEVGEGYFDGMGNYNLSSELHLPVFGFDSNTGFDVHYRTDPNINIPAGWHHFAAVHTFGQPADTQVYIDGMPLPGDWYVEPDQASSFPTPNSGQSYLIGMMTGAESAFYDGLLDEVRIWNIARTESEIKATMMQELAGDEEGLVGYWKFNEQPGETVAHDASSNGNHGILKDGAQFQAADKPPLQEPSPGGTWVNLLDGMVMVYVPAGSFMMGQENGDDNEAPLHEVYLDAFWIDQTEVTNAQFAVFMEDTGHVTTAEQDGWSWDSGPDWFEVAGADWRHPRGPDSDIDGLEDHPVVHVSWEDADAYCDWRGDRLPAEAEWEKAARGTDRRRFPWGNEFSADRLNSCDANCPVTSREESADDGYAYTSPVGTYQSGASPYGVLDMAGNVGEWTADWYQDNYYAQSPDSNPEGPASGSRKSERGGSWNVYPDEFSSLVTVRQGHPANHSASIIGFRCASSSAFRQPPPTGGSGVFVDSGQELGDSDSYVVALGDLDGDGDLDAFVGTADEDLVLFNDGSGQFVDTEQRLGDGYSTAVSLGDFDRDGDLDALVGNHNLVWLNDGDGTFLDSGQQLGSSGVEAVATGDVDGDGDLDALIGGGANSVWLNDGAGNFSDGGQSLGEYEAWAVALADVDGDGDLDAFFGVTGPNALWLNDGAGLFENSGQSMGNSESRVVAMGDLDGDGDLDAFITNHGGQANMVWLNDGNGLFRESGQRLGAFDSVDMALGDVDGDGDLDAFVANNGAQANRVWLNDGAAIFVDSGQELGDSFSEGLALGDLDGDGDLDAYEANMDRQPDRIWLNQD